MLSGVLFDLDGQLVFDPQTSIDEKLSYYDIADKTKI